MWKLTLGYGSIYMPPISKKREKKDMSHTCIQPKIELHLPDL
jgi:hypothetical protein